MKVPFISTTDELIEYFTYTFPDGGVITWDITEAKRRIAAGEILVRTVMPRHQLENLARQNDWSQAVVDRADPSIPGIGAPIIHDNEIIYVLIDGTHRAVHALQAGQVDYTVDLLSDAAARACVLKAPQGRVP